MIRHNFHLRYTVPKYIYTKDAKRYRIILNKEREDNNIGRSERERKIPQWITFRRKWHQVKIEVSLSHRYKWTRLIEDPQIKDQYTALLGVERATVYDQGLFTCQIEDYGHQQCLSTLVEIRTPPKVWIEPMSLTVRKVNEHFQLDEGSTTPFLSQVRRHEYSKFNPWKNLLLKKIDPLWNWPLK